MNHALKRKPAGTRSKVVKLPGKKKKVADPVGGDLQKEIEKRGMTVASFARHIGIPRSRIYKWFKGSAPKYQDRLKVNLWLNGGEENDWKKQLAQVQAVNKVLMNQVAKLMAKSTGQSVAESLASLKADISLHLADAK